MEEKAQTNTGFYRLVKPTFNFYIDLQIRKFYFTDWVTLSLQKVMVVVPSEKAQSI